MRKAKRITAAVMAAAMCMLSISAVPAAVTAETVVSAGTVDETAVEDSLNIREDIRERFRTYEVYSDSETKPELRLVSEPKRILKIYNASPTAFAYNDNIDDILAGSVLSEYYIVDYYDKATEYYRIGEEDLIKLNRTDGFSSVIENKAIQRLTDQDFVKKYISQDAETLNVYYLSGKTSMAGTAIYYNTTAGKYVYYKGHISGEYLFKLADFCDYEKAVTDDGKEHTDTNWTLNEYIWDFSACPSVDGITIVDRASIAENTATDSVFVYTVTEDNGHAVITGYTGTEEEIVIPSSLGGLPVTEIGAKAFAGNKTIRSVNIPDSIEYIREDAFADTPDLTSVQFAVGVKVIENGAFMNSGVIDIRLPYSITSLGNDEVPADGDTPVHGVFENCKSLERTSIPQYLEYLGDRTFLGCEKLEDVWGFAPNLETIGRQAFEGCISLHYFFSIYENVKSIGAYAFKDCTSLESLSFRNKECEIDLAAFEGSSVHKAGILPGSALEKSFRTDFPDITVKYIQTDDPAIIEADGLEYRIVLYHPSQDSEAVPVAYVSGAPEGATEVTVPDTVSGELQDYPVLGVYKEAFAGQDKLTSVTLPESVRFIQELAFSNTTSLKTIDLPDDLSVIEYGAFYRSGLTEITLPENCLLSYEHDRTFPNLYDEISIGPPTGYFENYCGAFEDCKELTSVTLSPAMTIIPSRAFLGCSKLTKVDGLENIQETGIQTFKDCTALEELEFSEAISLIRRDTVNNCNSLEKLVIPAEKCGIQYIQDLSPRIVIWCYEDSEFATYLPTSRKNNGGVHYLDTSLRPTQPATEPPTQKETEPPYYPTGENIKPGDANCDERITVSDVVAILQFIASKEKYPLSPEGQLNAEVDGVKGITGSDAIVVQRMDAGIWDKS